VVGAVVGAVVVGAAMVVGAVMVVGAAVVVVGAAVVVDAAMVVGAVVLLQNCPCLGRLLDPRPRAEASVQTWAENVCGHASVNVVIEPLIEPSKTLLPENRSRAVKSQKFLGEHPDPSK